MQEKITYHIDIISDKPSGYFVKVRELRGCMSQGETVEESLKNIGDALCAYMHCIIKHGDNLMIVRKRCKKTKK